MGNPNEELKLDAYTVKDAPRFERGGVVKNMRVATFYLGTHGPFAVEFPVAEFSVDKVAAEVARLREQIRGVATLQ